MERLSKEYGWTPNQIRMLPAQDISDYIEIISIRAQIEKTEMRKSKRK